MTGRFLVTGGAGFIGSHVVDRLVGRGADVVVLDDFNNFYDPASKRANLAPQAGRIQVIVGDLRDPVVWAGLAPEGWSAILHLGARAGVRPSLADPLLYTSTNIDGTARALRWACSGSRPIPLLFASSSSVYGDANAVPYSEEEGVLAPISPYGATKAAAEELVLCWERCFGLPVVCLRFFTVYGPRQRPDLAIHKFARLIDAGLPVPMFGDGSSSRDYTHVFDTVSGILAALDALLRGDLPHRVYNLGSDRAITLTALIEAIERALGRRALIQTLPMQQGDVRRTWADLRRSRDELGYAPAVDFEAGLADFVGWLRR